MEKYFPKDDDKTSYKGQPYLITFKNEQRAVAPGQSAVLYIDDVICGGGYIVKPIHS